MQEYYIMDGDNKISRVRVSKHLVLFSSSDDDSFKVCNRLEECILLEALDNVEANKIYLGEG